MGFLEEIARRKQEIVDELLGIRTEIRAAAEVEIVSIDAAIVALGGTPPPNEGGDDEVLRAAVQAAITRLGEVKSASDATQP